MDCVDVFEEIQQAVKTLRLMPPAFARQRMTAWPDIVQNFFDAYGYTPASVRIIPTAKQISRLDIVIDWMTWLEPEYAKIVWARAEGFSFRKIKKLSGLGLGTTHERFRIGIAIIQHRLKESA